jgi:hypothetical protein
VIVDGLLGELGSEPNPGFPGTVEPSDRERWRRLPRQPRHLHSSWEVPALMNDLAAALVQVRDRIATHREQAIGEEFDAR